MTLVIDFGTVNTVAVLDGRPVTVDGAPWLPSVVHGGVVGADAILLARGKAARDLKERLDPDEVRLLFDRVLTAARAQGGVVGAVVVTHPAGWPPERIRVLLSSAGAWARAVPEPVAVAAGHGVAAGETVLVVDAGGGTWDVAAVRGVTVVASASLHFGGNDVDRLIVERVRPSLRSVTDDGALLESSRAGKELLSRHESTEIVLPDHRAVRLDRAEFERMVAPSVDRLAALVTEVGGTTGARRVLLVGGSSRMPLLARRVAELTGLPVTTDPEPETAVVRGAQLLTRPTELEDPLAPPPRHAATAPPPRPPVPEPEPEVVVPAQRGPRRLLTVVILSLLVAAAAVGLGGERATTGRPLAGGVPQATASTATIPPVVAGNEVVNPGIAAFTSGALGEAAEYRHPGGNTFAVTVEDVGTAPSAPQPYLDAPAGFRWLLLRLHVANVEGPDFPHDPMEDVAVLDDRGQWLRQPYGAGQVACDEGTPPATRIPADGEVDVCGVVSVPDATPVAAVLFGVRSPRAQAPLRFPVDVPAASDVAAVSRVIGVLGGPAATVDGLRVQADLVPRPSGYLGGLVPAPGQRFVVVRMTAAATGQRNLTVLLRDDRGAFLSGRADVLRDCPALPATLVPDEPVYGCRLFEIAEGTPVAGVTLLGRTPDTTRWPTWRR